MLEKDSNLCTVCASLNRISNLFIDCNPSIVHLDLKCANVMLVSKDKSHMRCKIVDFGTARQISTVTSEECPVFNPTYLAPEVLKSQPYGPPGILPSPFSLPFLPSFSRSFF